MLDIRAKGGIFCIVALFLPLLDGLRRIHVLQKLGEDFLHISKADAVSAAVRHLDQSICPDCTRGVFAASGDLRRSDQTQRGPAA